MPDIQWYPGHIAKAEKKLKELTNAVDVVIEVIDARLPLSSRYQNVEKLIGNKPRLLVLNKSDLGDPYYISKWVELLKKETGLKVITTSSNSIKDISSIVSSAVELGKEKIEKLVAKGILPRPTRAIVIGMPNVGKSSIINKLIKKAKTKTGHKAGVTRTSQWVRVNPKLELLDTPGIIPLKLENQESAVKLAVVDAVSDKAYDNIEVAKQLINILFENYKKNLQNYYNLENLEKSPTLEDIANSRRWLILGDNPDIKRTAAMILSDFRHGRIGRINLDVISQECN
ncbi:MAG: ribosome biogenesis GTPase YlqF [Candidatus Gastranaerophilales bacterium]|nr:ribosome biogenesis GTPase YlqF [Candidatus Gastranaerophilales bacterium]